VGAYDRYCAVAQTQGRPVTDSMASTPAASPQPPKRKWPGVDRPGATIICQREGSSVGRRPRKALASIVTHGMVGDARRPAPSHPTPAASGRDDDAAPRDAAVVEIEQAEGAMRLGP